MELNKILSADVLDLIFEGRNKSYGAYDLRKTYSKRITKALTITASVAVLAFGGALLADSMGGPTTMSVQLDEINLKNVKQIEEKIKPVTPPPPRVDPPRVEMKQWTTLLIKKDDEVEKPPPTQDDLKDAKIDVVDREGIKGDYIPAPKNVDEGKKVIEERKEDDENKTWDKVEVEASFPGGEAKWHQYLERNCNAQVAADNGAPAGTYTTIVQFVVDKEGNISDVHSLTKHGFGMEEEAMRVIKKGPNWEPANQNGRAVKAYRKQPITFLVQGE